MDNSILNTIKKLLGIAEDYKHFDVDIVHLINDAFFSLMQLGVTAHPFKIVDEMDTWEFFQGSRLDLESAKTYIYLKVRMIFDPPATSYAQQAFETRIKELEWRLNVQAETPA